MRVPISFHLSPDIWIPIKWVDGINSDCFGEYHYDLGGGYIEMSKNIKPEYMDMVLLHEIRHAFIANCGYADLLKGYSPELEEALNELIDFMMRGLVKINPDSKRFKWKEISL